MNALRSGATLAHALPLQLRLHHHAAVVLAVCRPPFAGSGDIAGGRLMTPCAFRAAVGEAWRLQQAGQPVALCGLPDGAEPAVAVGVPPGGECHPAGIYQLPWPEGLLSVLTTTACPAITGKAAAGAGASVYLDRVTGVSLVQVCTDPAEADEAVLVLQDVLAAVATEELIAGISG